MRTLYQKMQDDIIAEYKQYSEGSFVPLEFLTSLDEQLSLIEDRITHAEAKILNRKSTNQTADSQLESSAKSNATLTSTAEFKLNKLEKDIEVIRKAF